MYFFDMYYTDIFFVLIMTIIAIKTYYNAIKPLILFKYLLPFDTY